MNEFAHWSCFKLMQPLTKELMSCFASQMLGKGWSLDVRALHS